jgi:hypothetical protein
MTSRLRLMPDFMIIGAQKGGTTSLFRLLEKHPCIIPAARKEVHYFDNMNNNLQYGMDWYRAHFPTLFNRYFHRWINHQNVITGEASPYYIFHPLAPERVFGTVPKVKLIAMLRDPVARAYSQYQHNMRKGYESLTFEQAIDLEEERLGREIEKLMGDGNYYSFNHAYYSYLSRGIYLQQLINWHRSFPKDQLLIIRSENFFSDPASVYGQVLAFLELPEWNLENYSKYNDSGGYPEMNPDTKEQLTDYFRPHNERLFEYLGVDLGW